MLQIAIALTSERKLSNALTKYPVLVCDRFCQKLMSMHNMKHIRKRNLLHNSLKALLNIH